LRESRALRTLGLKIRGFCCIANFWEEMLRELNGYL